MPPEPKESTTRTGKKTTQVLYLGRTPSHHREEGFVLDRPGGKRAYHWEIPSEAKKVFDIRDKFQRIASVKAGMVMAFFMHLITEKKLIAGVLGLTGIFFIALLLITLFTTDTMGPSSPVPFPPQPMEVPIEHKGF